MNSVFITTSRYPVGISTEFCFRWQKNLEGGRGKGIRGEKEKKLEGEKRKKWKGKKQQQKNRRIEPPSRVSILLKSPMPYSSPTVTLKLHCEQFWTFIVIVTFDLLRTLLRMRAYEQTRTIIYS